MDLRFELLLTVYLSLFGKSTENFISCQMKNDDI